MKKEIKWTVKPSDTNAETDIDDSYPQWPISGTVCPPQKKKKGKKILKTKMHQSCYQVFFRLSSVC